MILRHLFKRLTAGMAFGLPALAALAAATLLQSCVFDDFQECPNEYNLNFVYDRNMLGADAFGALVKSVDVKVFDSASGWEVYHHTEQGEALAKTGYKVNLPVKPGKYDILCWASMVEGNSFGHADPASEILADHSVALLTENGVSDDRLNNLFHGYMQGVDFIDNNTIGSTQSYTYTMHLTKNTNRVHVILHNLDGTELHEDDFILNILSNNARMDHDNSLRSRTAVNYRPWAITPIASEPGEVFDRAMTRAMTQTTLSAEFSLARLCAESKSTLEVSRVSDGEKIISIPLERNLLLYKGQFHADLSDDEYLNRRDDYTITFILDKNNNWNVSAKILIEDWATLPVQYQEW